MSCAGSGELGAGDVADKLRHPWFPPSAKHGDPVAEGKLRMFNTLTGRKDVFVPMNGREVRWYTCGPTVYDSSHVVSGFCQRKAEHTAHIQCDQKFEIRLTFLSFFLVPYIFTFLCS
mmetsp:Transcript_11593/g.21529  ORF Transcript_11593/g.21529 Transcript_11593/m.21529 type:complete len:117 (+) Transcript_11593:104-454(+)